MPNTVGQLHCVLYLVLIEHFPGKSVNLSKCTRKDLFADFTYPSGRGTGNYVTKEKENRFLQRHPVILHFLQGIETAMARTVDPISTGDGSRQNHDGPCKDIAGSYLLHLVPAEFREGNLSFTYQEAVP